MRTAIRRGWLDNAPQEDRDSLVARFQQATIERHADEAKGKDLRATVAAIWTAMELGRASFPRV